MTLDADVARLARTRPFSLMPREAVQLVAFSSAQTTPARGRNALSAQATRATRAISFKPAPSWSRTRAGPPDGARRVTTGALIGESALYAPVVRRVEARAVEDTVIIRIPRETFRRVLAEFPEAADKVRAALAERMLRLVDGLDAARVRSIDASRQPTRTPT